TARLDARGTLTAERVADFTVSARAVPTEGAELDSLVFDGSLKGPLARPRINGSLKAAGLRAQGSALDRIETRFSAEPAGPDPNASRFALSADARVEACCSPTQPCVGRSARGPPSPSAVHSSPIPSSTRRPS